MPIRIAEDVVKEIKRIGFMGESYSDVLRRILRMNRRHDKKIRAPSKIEDKI